MKSKLTVVEYNILLMRLSCLLCHNLKKKYYLSEDNIHHTHEVEKRSESASCSLDPVEMTRARLVTSLIIIGCLLPGLTQGDDVVR